MPPHPAVGSPPESHDAWNRLESQFGGRLGTEDEVYSLPLKLIRAICTHAPALLTPLDAKFERALRKASGTGFRQQQPFGCPILEAKQKNEVAGQLFGDVRLDIMRQTRLRMHASLVPSVAAVPRTSTVDRRSIAATAKQAAKRLQVIQHDVEGDALRHQYGYVGWLLTNNHFQVDRNRLRELWLSQPELKLFYPDRDVAEKLQTLGRQTPPMNGEILKALSDLRADTLNFFDKWGLDGMRTWQLPILSAPQQLMCDAIPAAQPNSSGITLFIPWSLLGSRDLNLAKIIEYHQHRQDLTHLSGWLYDSRKKGEWGVQKSGHLVPLYVYLHLALRRRYAQQLKRQMRKVDGAFAEYFSTTRGWNADESWSAGSIRKLRERMEKRLSSENCDRRSQKPKP